MAQIRQLDIEGAELFLRLCIVQARRQEHGPAGSTPRPGNALGSAGIRHRSHLLN
jgi:hypothetical protein